MFFVMGSKLLNVYFGKRKNSFVLRREPETMSSIKRCTDGFPVQVAPSGGSIAIDVIACGVVVVIVIGASVPNLKHVHATIGKAITDDRLDALIFAAHGDKLLSNNGHAGGNVDFRVPHDVGGDDLRGPCGQGGETALPFCPPPAAAL